jgi:K+-transporting ATPase ATPase A chain
VHPRTLSAAVALGLSAGPRSAGAEEPPAPFTLGGYVEAYYQWNFRRPAPGITHYRGFDNRHNSFTLSNVALDASWERERLLGRLALQVGHTPATYYAAEPDRPGAEGTSRSDADLWRYVQQAYVGYKADVGEGLEVTGGLFLSPIGPETIPVKDSWNWSRSNLFFGLPFYHTGVRATQALTRRWAATLAVYNGWNSVVDNNPEKSLSPQLTYSDEKVSLSVLYFGGVERPEKAPEGRAFRHLFDAHVTWQATERLALLLHGDTGFERNRLGTSWWAAGALYARVRVVDRLFAVLRGDLFREAAARSARGEAAPLFWPVPWVSSGTVTLDVRPHERASLRLEYRHDQAAGPMYFGRRTEGDGVEKPFVPSHRSQDTVTLGATTWFLPPTAAPITGEVSPWTSCTSGWSPDFPWRPGGFFASARGFYRVIAADPGRDPLRLAPRLPAVRAPVPGEVVMTPRGALQILIYLALLVALSVPLGEYMARVYRGEALLARRILGPAERLLYRLCGVQADEEMDGKTYAGAVLLFNLAGMLALYLLLRAQASLPLNPAKIGAMPPELAFNTAVSFATNTNWQAYSGESALGYLSQMLGLGAQNFLSAATGMAVLAAFLRGFTRKNTDRLGNFWVDLTRGTLYILLPLSLLLALLLASQGVIQTFAGPARAQLLEPLALPDGGQAAEQILALGPAASQVAIKQLGTNGGGFFGVNSAHPLENPTPLSNLLQLLSILLIPGAQCFTFGALVEDRRQGWAIFGAMMAVFVPLVLATVLAEQGGTPTLASLGLDLAATDLAPGGNMEGKEVRFGVVTSALWAVATTAASNGSVNAMHDSFTPLGGLVPMWLMQLGEILFGGVGCGLYGMLVHAILAVFLAGLMVGRTPEYLGKKIEAREMKMASLVVLLPAAAVLLGTGLACVFPGAREALANPGAHGFSEVLYAFSSGANNNGSAFGGLNASGPFYALVLGVCMLIGRYWVIVPVLVIAGSLAGKRHIPAGPGTLPTHTPLFVAMLVGTILLLGALTFLPALALGPIVEHLQMQAR